MAKNKKFKVQVTRYYSVTDTFEVEATSEEKGKEKAEALSGNKDYSGELLCDDVTSEII